MKGDYTDLGAISMHQTNNNYTPRKTIIYLKKKIYIYIYYF